MSIGYNCFQNMQMNSSTTNFSDNEIELSEI